MDRTQYTRDPSSAFDRLTLTFFSALRTPFKMTSHLVPTLDPQAATRLLRRSRPSTRSSWLCEEIAQRMLSRLDWMNQLPARWLHWEPVWGGLAAHEQLLKKLPKARAWVDSSSGADLARAQALGRPSWAFWRGGTPVWTAQSGVVDMLWANQSLHLQADPMATLQKWKQALSAQGYVLFSSLGPDTLKELRAVYARKGWPDAMHAYTDMHDWGDMLVEAGFAEPVMDMETLTLTYASAERLIADLRDYGGNAARLRFQGLRGKQWRAHLIDAIEGDVPRTHDGQLQVTVEVIYGHAIKPELKVPMQSTTHVALTDMRAMLGQTPKTSE
jgi:malonyl-CoA O-methyltransferase